MRGQGAALAQIDDRTYEAAYGRDAQIHYHTHELPILHYLGSNALDRDGRSMCLHGQDENACDLDRAERQRPA